MISGFQIIICSFSHFSILDVSGFKLFWYEPAPNGRCYSWTNNLLKSQCCLANHTFWELVLSFTFSTIFCDFFHCPIIFQIKLFYNFSENLMQFVLKIGSKYPCLVQWDTNKCIYISRYTYKNLRQLTYMYVGRGEW